MNSQQQIQKFKDAFKFELTFNVIYELNVSGYVFKFSKVIKRHYRNVWIDVYHQLKSIKDKKNFVCFNNIEF